MRTLKRLINLALFGVAVVALVVAANAFRTRLNSVNAVDTRMTAFDQLLVSNYIELLRGSDLSRSVSNDPTPVAFVVRPGESVAQIGQNLQRAGLVRDGDLFRLYVRLRGLDQTIQGGSYQLRANMTIPEVALALQRATALETSVTIPEGKRLEEVADLLKNQLGPNYSATDFTRLVRRGNYAYPFLKDLPDGASLEGYLFPDTYRVPQNPTAQDVLLRMLDNFGAKAAPLLDQGRAKGLTPRQTLTLASIVEREAVIASERPTIASVYLNRMNQGMLLQADPTTQYALEFTGKKGVQWWQPITADDYKYKDPYGYNTYQHPGLPPGPIASPGLSSLQAVVNAPKTNFIFFVANCNGNGSHQFSVTFAEHLRKLCQ